jgi:hypothetical protein
VFPQASASDSVLPKQIKMLTQAEELDNVKNSNTTAQGTIAELQEQLKAAEHGFATALVGR